MELGLIDPEGVLEGATQIASPNHDERPEGEDVRLLVVHNISLPPGEFGGDGVVRLFTNTLDFSAHPYYETLREHNPLLFDFVLKRTLHDPASGARFAPEIFLARPELGF